MLRSASIVSIAFVASRLLGLLREVILARKFGTTGEYDAYVSAFRIPDLLFLVIMAGSFGAAFIPVFSGFLSRDRDDQAWALASAVINLAAVTMVAAALFALALAGPIMRYVVAPGLAPDDREIAVNVMRILLLSQVFLGLGIAAKGILEAEDRFTLPALAPVIYNAAIIVGALALGSSIGVYGVAIGVVVGAFGHFLVQVPGLLGAGIRYTPRLTLQVEGLRKVGALLLPRVIGQAAFQLNFIVVNAFASDSGIGHVSALNYAWQLMMLPHGVLALSASTVVFPTMARLFEHGQFAELQQTLVRALRPLLFLTLPASVGLFAFRVPIVQSVFQSGAFTGHSTRLVTDPLAFLAIGLTGYAVVEILTRTYYAMHDTRTPVATGIAIIILNVILCAVLVDRLDHTGLAVSLSLTTGVEALILLAVLRVRLGGIDPDFGGWLARVAAATLAMLLICLSIQTPLADATEPGQASRLLQLLLILFSLGIGGASYVIAAYYLRVPELQQVARLAAARIPPLARLLDALGDRRAW